MRTSTIYLVSVQFMCDDRTDYRALWAYTSEEEARKDVEERNAAPVEDRTFADTVRSYIYEAIEVFDNEA